MTSVARVCSVSGCKNKQIAKTLCSTHYRRHRLGQDLGVPVRYRSRGRTCSLEWCADKHFARGYCASHLRAVEKYKLPDGELHKLHGACNICGEEERRGRRLSADHDHNCCPGKTSCGECVRGFLCWDCNRAIGTLKDSPKILRSAAAYLDDWYARIDSV